MRARLFRLLALGALLATALLVPATTTLAIAPGTDPFQTTWARTDQPVAAGAASRTWMWGPSAFSSATYEPYTESPDGSRVVQYYDKTRMEITHPDAVNDGVWYVTNGLLATELVTGNMQVGDNDFVQRNPAQVNIAGDADDANGPTYASFTNLLNAPAGDGGLVTARVGRDGSVTNDPNLAGYGVAATQLVDATQHRVADVFWAFMTSQGTVFQDGQFSNQNLFVNPFYATGYPKSEPYWARVKVAGTVKDVLVQVFERRVLTYTPDNPTGWQVEAGNVGQHYYKWRYDTDIPSEPPTSDLPDDPIGPSPMVNWPVDHSGQATLSLSNQSPYPLVVTLTGPTTTTITLDACGDCIVYASDAAFEGCRNDTPSQQIGGLPPGNYEVTAEWQSGNVTPAVGPWTFVPNADYGECLYVVQQDVSGGSGALAASHGAAVGGADVAR